MKCILENTSVVSSSKFVDLIHFTVLQEFA